MSSHLILVGACYLDTLLNVPFFPAEDSKLRATTSTTRLGGNCPNSIQVLRQLLSQADGLTLHLISCLPSRSSPASQRIIASLAGDGHQLPHPGEARSTAPNLKQRLRSSITASLEHCIFREDHVEPASSYIIRSAETGSRTIVNYNDLPEISAAEFEQAARAFDPAQDTWWHFEGRIPSTALSCIRLVRAILPRAKVSVEVERPGREGLAELAADADVVFYSRAWAESRGYSSPEACLKSEAVPKASMSLCTWGADGAAAMSHVSNECCHYPVKQQVDVIDAVGAGDTFIAAMLYALIRHMEDWDMGRKVSFAVDLATRKVQQEGFQGLGAVITDRIETT